ncbi:MAG: hypothetical protein ACI9DC_001704 [Gammaproteobacteria bacterium]|jgi:hypothetical protein
MARWAGYGWIAGDLQAASVMKANAKQIGLSG